MIITLILLSVLFVTALFAYLLIKKSNSENLVLKIGSVVLFLIYMFRLFSSDSIDQTFNIFYLDIDTPIDASATWLFEPMMTLLIIMLRWFTLLTITWLIVFSVYKTNVLKWVIAIFGFITVVLNLVFFNENLIAFQNSTDLTYRTIQFAIETGVTFVLVNLVIVSIIKHKDKFSIKRDLLDSVVLLIGSLFALMPLSFLQTVVGYYGTIPKEFNMEHLFVMSIPIILMIVTYKYMKSKSQEAKNGVLAFMAIAAIIQYFYPRREDLAALPFHLCNMAVILIFFAILFKRKSLFYFAYFANVIGAIGGIFLPNYEVDFFTMTVIHFGYNHFYALVIPIMGVALGMFERPKLKAMYQAIAVFTVYYLVILVLNAWFNNYTLVDYFFAYDNFLTEMFGVEELQYQYVVSFEYAGLTFKFFWLYQLLYYLAFVFLMFVSWYIYDAVFQALDNGRRLKAKQLQMKQDHLALLASLDGRDLSERMKEEGANMIKIEHFSKRYGKSNRYAVKDFNLEVGPGEIFGFLGHNGAGKSTTIKCMVGIQSITEGEIFIDGFSIKTQPIEAKLRLGYVSDNHAVYEKLTGREYIHYVADLYRVPKDIRDQRLNHLLETLSLAHAIDHEVKSYSHGMKQKLVVIASLIHEPPVWVLDEPLTGLDPTSAFQIKETMREYAQKGNIVFFSSHVIEVVEKICTKIAVINQGELMGVYEVAQLQKDGISLESLYMSGKK